MADQSRGPNSPPYTFDAAAFHAELDKALNIAEGVQDPVKTPAVERDQAGQKILVFRCPTCRRFPIAMSGEGKHKCHGCGAWLQVEKAG